MCSRHAEYGAGYDMDALQADGAQEANPVFAWARICGRPHEWVKDNGIGMVESDDTIAECDNCRELRSEWLAGRGSRVA